MKLFKKFVAIAALAVAPLVTNAASIGALDPLAFDSAGTPSVKVCGPCAAATTYSGTYTFTFDIINNVGILNIGASASITPDSGGTFTVFTYTLTGPNSESASGGFGSNSSIPSDLLASIGTYTVNVVYSYTAARASSANFSLNVTTAPVPTPEPGSLALLGLGLVGLGMARRRKV
jgi:hypothetical protein